MRQVQYHSLWVPFKFCIFDIINNMYRGRCSTWDVVSSIQILYLWHHKQLNVCIVMNVSLLYDVLELKKVLLLGRTFLFLKCFWGFWNASLLRSFFRCCRVVFDATLFRFFGQVTDMTQYAVSLYWDLFCSFGRSSRASLHCISWLLYK